MTNDLRAARQALLECLEKERRTPPIPIDRAAGEAVDQAAKGSRLADRLTRFCNAGTAYSNNAALCAPANSTGIYSD